MTAVREIVDSSSLDGIFDLPPDITMKDIRRMRLEERYKEYLT